MFFEGQIVTMTLRAVLFQGVYWSCPQWMPLSQVHLRRCAETGEVYLSASSWIAKQKGIVEFTEVECPEPEDD